MATVKLTCTGNTPVSFQMPAYAGRVTATMISAVAETWITSDGTAPQAPTNTARTDGSNQKTLPGVAGAQIVTMPPIPNGFFVNPLIQLASAGAAVVELEW